MHNYTSYQLKAVCNAAARQKSVPLTNGHRSGTCVTPLGLLQVTFTGPNLARNWSFCGKPVTKAQLKEIFG